MRAAVVEVLGFFEDVIEVHDSDTAVQLRMDNMHPSHFEQS